MEFQLSSNLVNLSYNAGRGTELMDGEWYGRLLSNKLPWHVDPFTISTNWVSSELMFNQLELNQLEVFPILQVTHFEILPNWNLLGWNCEIWLKLWSLVEIVKFGRNCEIWWKLWNLVEIVNICEHLWTSVNIWEHLGTSGNILEHQGNW